MPIEFSERIRPISQSEFEPLAYQVTGLAFGVHRDLGPLFLDESIYQRELTHRCRQAGMKVTTEEPVKVSFRSLSKTYSIDMLVNGSALFEIKTAKALHDRHRKQAINYLLLTGLHHGKLINFYPASVEHEFVSTQLTAETRRQYPIENGAWIDADTDSRWLSQFFHDLLADWGAFLDTDLYYDAVLHFRGGKESVVRPIEIRLGTRRLGTQRAHLLNPTTAFKITALTRDLDSYRRHLSRFLNNTTLSFIQWINLNHHEITFETTVRTDRRQND